MRRLRDEEIARLRDAVRTMASLSEDRGYEFNRDWVQSHGWVVVPVEDTGHFAEEEIERIVAALSSAGHQRCLALGALDLGETLPSGFEVAISADDLRAFNEECGIFRFLIASPDLSWAISCNEWFNLFTGPAALVQQMVGAPIERALEEFLDYARVVEQGPEGHLVQIARQYGA
jgi:hypothetical protein